MRGALKVVVITLTAFGLYYALNKWYFRPLYECMSSWTGGRPAAWFLSYLIVGLPVMAGLFLIHKPGEVLQGLGLRHGWGRAFLLAAVATAPMFIGYACFSPYNREISANGIFIGTVCAALFEEIFFRGFLFGQLFRYGKVGFIPSVILCAIPFASGHLWQSHDGGELAGIFVVTFLGAAWFAWLYIEWDNLWVAIFLHLLMNLSWDLFSGENALGGKYENLFRGITIAVTIAGTLLYKKHKGLKLAVNRENLVGVKVIREIPDGKERDSDPGVDKGIE